MQEILNSEAEMSAFAARYASTIQGSACFCLSGPLGAGKTVFARALIRALCGNSALNVPSPTFTLVQIYDGTKGTIHHFDLYRIENAGDIYELGWDDALSSGITIVEWPERLGPLLPDTYIDVRIVPFKDNPDKREILIRSVAP